MCALSALMAVPAMAQDVEFANPKLEDGSFVVKYDLDNHKFAATNDFEIDETFIFAIDVTGTGYEDALATTGRNPQILGRGMARDIYVGDAMADVFPHFAASGNLDGRLIHIEGNIYGMMFNIFQNATGLYKDGKLGYYEEGGEAKYDCLEPGATVTFGFNGFPFGWSADNMGAEWWDGIATPIQNLWFSCAPYTGTKTGKDFYWDDYVNALTDVYPGLESDNWTDKGFAPASAWTEYNESGAVNGLMDDNMNATPVYYNLQGVRVANPEQGIFIMRQGNKVAKIVK